MGAKIPSPWGTWTPFNTPILHWPHSPHQTTARLVHAPPHNYATKFPLVTMGCPKFTPKTALPLWQSPPHLIHPSLDRPHSPSQMASGSNQPFCHSTLSGQTDSHIDRLTDRWDRRKLDSMTAYARHIDRERHANNTRTLSQINKLYFLLAVLSKTVVTVNRSVILRSATKIIPLHGRRLLISKDSLKDASNSETK